MAITVYPVSGKDAINHIKIVHRDPIIRSVTPPSPRQQYLLDNAQKLSGRWKVGAYAAGSFVFIGMLATATLAGCAFIAAAPITVPVYAVALAGGITIAAAVVLGVAIYKKVMLDRFMADNPGSIKI